MQLPVFVSVEGAQQFKDLNRRLREAARGDLRKELRKQIKSEGQPTLMDIRRAVRAVDVSSSKDGRGRPQRSSNLRARTAKATKLSVTATGIRIVVRGEQVDPAYPTLPKYLDASLGRYDRWRHPVFGHTDRWVQQRGEPWFFATAVKHAPAFRRAVLDAMNHISDEIAR